MDYMTPDEWLEKADWEGGVEGGLEYGLGAHNIDPMKYPEFREAVREAEEARTLFADKIYIIDNYTGESE